MGENRRGMQTRMAIEAATARYEHERLKQEQNKAIINHEATQHIGEMNKVLRSCSDITDQGFVDKAIAEALIYLLKRARDEDTP
jgi:hypothetical protein